MCFNYLKPLSYWDNTKYPVDCIKTYAGFQDKWHYYVFVVYITMLSVAHVAHRDTWNEKTPFNPFPCKAETPRQVSKLISCLFMETYIILHYITNLFCTFVQKRAHGVCVCVCACVRLCVCDACVRLCVGACKCARVDIYTHTHTPIYMHACKNTQVKLYI